jgi:hypothetical protein
MPAFWSAGRGSEIRGGVYQAERAELRRSDVVAHAIKERRTASVPYHGKGPCDVRINVRDFQISGGPSWIGSDRYDVLAKPGGNTSSQDLPTDAANMTDDERKVLLQQLRQRTQALLADRFNLAIHEESREEQVYALVAGKDGPKLVETKEGAQAE